MVISPTGEQLSVAVPFVQLITGPVRSRFVICCTQVAEFPQASTAFHVRVIVVIQPFVLGTSDDVIVDAPQASVAVADPTLAGVEEASHSITTSAGQVMTGAVISRTVIV